METSVSYSNQHGSRKVVAQDTTPVGETHKDYWAKLAREGDPVASIKLAACYEMTGEMREGLDVINDLLSRRRHNLPVEIRSEALLRKAVLQADSPLLAWPTIRKASLDVEPSLRWRLHNQRGRILSDLKKYDPAIIEYTEAAYYAEQVPSPESVGHAYNNLASIYRRKALYIEAHESVDKAISLWQEYEYLPHALDQKALVHLDEKKYAEARSLVLMALAKTSDDHHRWRADFLCTLANVEAGLGNSTESARAIDGAFEISDYLDDKDLRLKIFMAGKLASERMHDSFDKAAVQLAWSLTDGKLRQAAKKLGIRHPTLLRAIKKYSLDRDEKLK